PFTSHPMRTLPALSAGLLSLGSAVILVSCAAPSGPARPPQKAEHVMYQWYDDGGPGNVAVTINLTEQKAFVSRGGRDIGWSFVATGKEGHGTPGGRYKITEKIIDKYSNRYGWIEDEF